MKNISYKTSGTCSRQIDLTIDNDNKIASVNIIGGCDGNLKGISKLLIGMDADEVADKFGGIRCGFKQTSCPDQISKAIKAAKAKENWLCEYEKWVASAVIDRKTREDIYALSEKDKKESFFSYLAFGTGGLRGIMGAGTNRMNIYTVRHASQALANVVNRHFENPSIVIAHDSRNNAVLFTDEAAKVFTANNIKVYTFDDLRPTPLLSFAVTELKCSAGVVLTASHNPKEYNGYKVYGADGVQITNALADEISAEMAKVDIFTDVKTCDRAITTVLGEDFDDRYLACVAAQQVCPEAIKRHPDLPIVYTPFHGAGRRLVPEALKRAGFTNIHTVTEQMIPDGNFPTVVSPNPEKPEGFTLGIKLAKETGSALVIANDPDSDRVGIAVRKNDGEYVLLTGNQTGAILVNYVLSALAAKNELPEKPFMVKTIVTADTGELICKKYGAEMFSVLTGFKFIGEKVLVEEKKGKTFLFGYEESYGGRKGMYTGDKDGVCVALLLAEAAAYAADSGKTLWDTIEGIYAEFGYHAENTADIVLPGIDGLAKMKHTTKRLREEPFTEINGVKVDNIKDYLKGIDGLPLSDVLLYQLHDGTTLVIRPSGTEPKLKLYTLVSADNRENAEAKKEAFRKEFERLVLEKTE